MCDGGITERRFVTVGGTKFIIIIIIVTVGGGSETLEIEQVRCNVVGAVAEGDVDCFVIGRHAA